MTNSIYEVNEMYFTKMENGFVCCDEYQYPISCKVCGESIGCVFCEGDYSAPCTYCAEELQKGSTEMSYCVFCGFDTESQYLVCETCHLMSGAELSYRPAVCGDEVCYLLPNGELNLDGETCTHSQDFDLLASQTY